MYRAVLVAVTLAMVMTACGNVTGAEDTAEPTDSPPAEAPPTDDLADRDDQVSVAIVDLAAHTGVNPTDIEVAAHEEVTWRDGSLGCPEPGESYTQALVDGYRITLRADGEEHAYHGAQDQPPFRCDDPDPNEVMGDGAAAASTPTPADLDEGNDPTDPPAAPPREDDVTDREGPVAEAIADLAQHSGVDPADIDLVAYEQVTWRDGALGCPQPGMMYTQALVDGYRIVLRAGAQDVTYHGATGKPPFRCDNPDPGGAIDDRS